MNIEGMYILEQLILKPAVLVSELSSKFDGTTRDDCNQLVRHGYARYNSDKRIIMLTELGLKYYEANATKSKEIEIGQQLPKRRVRGRFKKGSLGHLLLKR